MPTEKHLKHGNVVRSPLGNYGRNEWAFLGAPCGVINTLIQDLVVRLSPNWHLATMDATHGNDQPAPLATTDYTDYISFHRTDTRSALNAFHLRQLFHPADAVLINGNHFNAQRQILIIDPAKRESLERKLDRLSDVQLVLLQEGMAAPWPFLQPYLEGKDIPMLRLTDTEAIATWFEAKLISVVPPLYGLVLAGGYSKRMGTDKGLINYHGKPQREYVADLLQPCCESVFISCRADQLADIPPPYQGLPDSFLDLGPFGAILSAFRAHPHAAWLVLACDLPLLDAATLQYLAQHRNPARLATAFQSPDNEFPEPLITIWEPKSYPTLLQFLAQGYACPRKVLINTDTQLLQAPDPRVLTNVNSPEERAALGE
jgi:molybdopterin-guanine dinucleotide biosynthesis protein A